MLTLAISLAAIGAFGLAVGTHLQHRAISHRALASDGQDLNKKVIRALKDPLWVLGTCIIMLQTGLNIVALGLAPVAVVQPVGSLALICAVIISARALGVPMNRRLVLGIITAVISVTVFTTISATSAVLQRPTEAKASVLAWMLLALIVLGVTVNFRATRHMIRVVTVGVMFGAVASAMHVVAVEVIEYFRDHSEPRSLDSFIVGMQVATECSVSVTTLWILFVLLTGCTVVGAWLVQTAYSTGPPETVLAGLTVIDPLVAVLTGALLLGEYAPSTPLGTVGILVSGGMACISIIVIVQNHPALSNKALSAHA